MYIIFEMKGYLSHGFGWVQDIYTTVLAHHPSTVRVAEWSKAPDLRSGPLMWTWVRIAFLTSFCSFLFFAICEIDAIDHSLLFTTDTLEFFKQYKLLYAWKILQYIISAVSKTTVKFYHVKLQLIILKVVWLLLCDSVCRSMLTPHVLTNSITHSQFLKSAWLMKEVILLQG